ncbi:hypothetical protein [Pseudomonas sp. 22 E 5]|nr:hypothetical protein [Pseudomonas sp. 22 E 5]
MSMTIPASKPIRFLRDRRSTRYQVDTADRWHPTHLPPSPMSASVAPVYRLPE